MSSQQATHNIVVDPDELQLFIMQGDFQHKNMD